MNKIKISKFLLDTGERYCIIIDKENGIPLYYPNLFLTTQLRNRGYSISTVESKAVNLSLFYRFLKHKNIDIETYISSGKYLSRNDIENLINFLSKSSDLKKHNFNNHLYLSKKTLCHRLDSIVIYLSWLAEELLQLNSSGYKDKLARTIKYIKELKPRYRSKKSEEHNEDKALSDNIVDLIMETIDCQSPINPFEPFIRRRNEMIIIILFELGIRCGELLNIKIEDIDFQKKRLSIIRRADEKNDPRINQPLVKTLDRVLPISDGLVMKLWSFIIYDRKPFAKGKTDFLFITYKSGPSQGKPLTISAYHKIISKIRDSNPLLKDLKGHRFRHTWNYNFSRFLDSLPEKVNENHQIQMREELMGWKEGSGTASIYNKRFLKEQSDEAFIRLQEKLNSKKGMKNNDK